MQTFVDRDNAAFKAELQPTSPGRKRQNEWLDDDDEAVDVNNFSPKKMSSSRSSATLGNVTPQRSRQNSIDGTEMEMTTTEGVDLIGGIEGVGMSRIREGTDASGPTIQLPPSHQAEMVEIGHVSPVARAFHLDFKGKDKDMDQEMADAEHVEYTSAAPGDAEENKL